MRILIESTQTGQRMYQQPESVADFKNTSSLCNTLIFFCIAETCTIQLFTDVMALQLLLHRPERSKFCGNLRVTNHVTFAIVLD